MSAEQQGELRYVAGCLQWLCRQSRPELSPFVSLNSFSFRSHRGNVKSRHFALDFLQRAPLSLVLSDVPLNPAATLVSNSDASFLNSRHDLKRVPTESKRADGPTKLSTDLHGPTKKADQ